MTIEQLKFYLKRGDFMGFVKETDSDDYLGWISLKQRMPNPRIDEVFAEDERPDLLLEQSQIEQRPFVLEICELSKDAYENDHKLPDLNDYRVADVLYFETLIDVQLFLEKYSKRLEEIKWMSEVPSL